MVAVAQYLFKAFKEVIVCNNELHIVIRSPYDVNELFDCEMYQSIHLLIPSVNSITDLSNRCLINAT